MKIRFLATLFALCALAAQPGCKTTRSAAPPRAVLVEIKKGMSASEVRAALGEPKQIKPIDSAPEENAEIWVYLRTVSNETTMVQIGTKQTPYIDPITGQSRPINDPIIVPRTARVVDKLELLLSNGAVVTWKQERLDESNLISQ